MSRTFEAFQNDCRFRSSPSEQYGNRKCSLILCRTVFFIYTKMMVIDVTRKGGKRDSVNVAAFAKPYLEQYLAIRDKRYKTEKTDTALFLTLYRGVPNRIDASSVEKMVAKYSEDFKVRVTPHKLRHTLATRLYDATKSQVLVRCRVLSILVMLPNEPWRKFRTAKL